MSVKISGQVWELDIDPMDKLFLLCIADHADHDGNNIKPGNDLICAKTGLSHQTVSAKISKFIEDGILIPSDEVFGRGKKREFSVNLTEVTRRDYFIQKEQRKMQAGRTFQSDERCKQGAPSSQERCKLTNEKVQADSGKVQADKFSHDKERARVEPSEPSREPSVITAATIFEKIADRQISIPETELLNGEIQQADFETWATFLRTWLASYPNTRSFGKLLPAFKDQLAQSQARTQANGFLYNPKTHYSDGREKVGEMRGFVC